MEITVKTGQVLTHKSGNWFSIDLGKVSNNQTVSAKLAVTGVNIVKGRTSCQCTLAEIKDNNVEINYTGNRKGKISQRLVLTTDESLEIYIDVVGEVI